MSATLADVGTRVDLEDLLDAEAVAELLGLSRRSAVGVYVERYADFPRPVLRGTSGRCQYWLRADVMAWARGRRGEHP
jgi:predicted DNA-binding transcriptional regulator AlpA